MKLKLPSRSGTSRNSNAQLLQEADRVEQYFPGLQLPVTAVADAPDATSYRVACRTSQLVYAANVAASYRTAAATALRIFMTTNKPGQCAIAKSNDAYLD